jgi:sarcosine oxidase subunit alpha
VLTARGSELGGRIKHSLVTRAAPSEVLAALDDVREAENVTCVAPGTVVAAFGDRFLVDRRDRMLEVTASRSILATGAYERGLTFPDNDRPGVMLTSALRRLVLDEDVRLAPSAKGASNKVLQAVIVTRDDWAHAAADELEAAGVRVAAVLDERAGARVERVHGGKRVRGVRCLVEGRRRTIRCDVVAMSGGWQPADELRFQATSRGTTVVSGDRAERVDGAEHAEGDLPLLQAVGAVAGTRTIERAFADGAAAGAWAGGRPRAVG